MPRVNILCYHWDRVHRWNDVPLIDAPLGNVSQINMIDHGPDQYLYITSMIYHRSRARIDC